MRRLISSTPLRLSVALVALFAIVSFASFAATYIVARDSSEQTLRDTLQQEMAGLRAAPTRAALVALVRSQSLANAPERRILSYQLPEGIVVGNAALIADATGYRAFALGDRDEITGSFFALTEMVHGGLLTVAVNADRIDGVQQAFLSVFVFSLIPTTLILLGGGVWLARRSGRRLARIESALDALTAGDLAARVSPTPGRHDDLSRIGARIDRMAEAQERQVGALRQVTADIAHDLKTPIQRVSVLLERLQAGGLDARAAELAGQARMETDSIGRIFSALLQIAQLEGQGARSGFGRVDLCALAATLVELFEPEAEAAGITLGVDLPDGPVEVTGDRTLLGQALTNLIENALRHGGAGAAVRVAVGQDGTLSVSDTGPGIPADERDKVTRRLYRLERSRTTPGSGLGLSLVAAIVDLHGGRLELSDAAPGLRVTIHLPR